MSDAINPSRPKIKIKKKRQNGFWPRQVNLWLFETEDCRSKPTSTTRSTTRTTTDAEQETARRKDNDEVSRRGAERVGGREYKLSTSTLPGWLMRDRGRLWPCGPVIEAIPGRWKLGSMGAGQLEVHGHRAACWHYLIFSMIMLIDAVDVLAVEVIWSTGVWTSSQADGASLRPAGERFTMALTMLILYYTPRSLAISIIGNSAGEYTEPRAFSSFQNSSRPVCEVTAAHHQKLLSKRPICTPKGPSQIYRSSHVCPPWKAQVERTLACFPAAACTRCQGLSLSVLSSAMA